MLERVGSLALSPPLISGKHWAFVHDFSFASRPIDDHRRIDPGEFSTSSCDAVDVSSIIVKITIYSSELVFVERVAFAWSLSNHTHIVVVFVGLEDPDIIEVLRLAFFVLEAAHDYELFIVETAEAYVFAGCDHGEDKHFKS